MTQPFLVNAPTHDPAVQRAMDQLVFSLNRDGVTDFHLNVSLSDRLGHYLYPWYHLGEDPPGFGKRYYVGGHNGDGTLTTGSPAIDTIFCTPISVPKTMRVTELGIDVTAVGAGSDVVLGIYKSTDDRWGNLYPGDLVAMTGLLTPSAPGPLIGGVNAVLDGQHLYWLAFNAMVSSGTMRCLNLTDANPILGFPATFGNTPSWGHTVGYAMPVASPVLPHPYPASGTPATSTPIPAVYFYSPGYEGEDGGYQRRIQVFRVTYPGLQIRGSSLLKAVGMLAHRFDSFITVQVQVLRDGDDLILGRFDSRENVLSREIPYVYNQDEEWTVKLYEDDIVEIEIQAYGGSDRDLIDLAFQLDLRFVGG